MCCVILTIRKLLGGLFCFIYGNNHEKETHVSDVTINVTPVTIEKNTIYGI